MQDDNSVYFNDIIHGRIRISELEKSLLVTAPLTRMRNIKQLGTAGFLWNASHTRFDHCIGVMHLASETLEKVFDNSSVLKPEKIKLQIDNEGHQRDFNWEEIRIIFRLAGLFHDLGHAPLSHVTESFVRRNKYLWSGLWEEIGLPEHQNLNTPPSHEVLGISIISKDEEIRNIIENDAGIPLWPITQLMTGVFPEISGRFHCLGNILNSDIDVDQLDYSLRDTYYLGKKEQSLGFGKSYTYHNFVNALRLVPEPLPKKEENDGSEKYYLAFEESDIENIDQFFMLRSLFLKAVPQNSEIRKADLHFISAFNKWFNRTDNTDSEPPHSTAYRLFTKSTDADLVNNLARCEEANKIFKRIQISSRDFGPTFEYKLSAFPPIIRYYLVKEAYNEEFELEKKIGELINNQLNTAYDVLVGINIPKGIVDASIKVSSKSQHSTKPYTLFQYYQKSTFARAFTEENSEQSSLIIAVPNASEKHYERIQTLISNLFDIQNLTDVSSNNELLELLSSTNSLTPDPSKKSYRLDLLVLTLHTIIETAMHSICDKVGKQFGSENAFRDAALSGLWIRRASGIQCLVRTIQKNHFERNMQYPYKFATGIGRFTSSRDLAKDLFLLRNMGLLRDSFFPVPRSSVMEYTLRSDYQLTETCKQLVSDMISDLVESNWQKELNKIEHCFKDLTMERKGLNENLAFHCCFNTDKDCDSCNTTDYGFHPCDVIVSPNAETSYIIKKELSSQELLKT